MDCYAMNWSVGRLSRIDIWMASRSNGARILHVDVQLFPNHAGCWPARCVYNPRARRYRCFGRRCSEIRVRRFIVQTEPDVDRRQPHAGGAVQRCKLADPAGRELPVRARVNRPNRDRVHCRLPDGTICAVPLWMTDSEICLACELGDPLTTIETLIELAGVLDDVTPSTGRADPSIIGGQGVDHGSNRTRGAAESRSPADELSRTVSGGRMRARSCWPRRSPGRASSTSSFVANVSPRFWPTKATRSSRA